MLGLSSAFFGQNKSDIQVMNSAVVAIISPRSRFFESIVSEHSSSPLLIIHVPTVVSPSPQTGLHSQKREVTSVLSASGSSPGAHLSRSGPGCLTITFRAGFQRRCYQVFTRVFAYAHTNSSRQALSSHPLQPRAQACHRRLNTGTNVGDIRCAAADFP
jgi:hypothetical protein